MSRRAEEHKLPVRQLIILALCRFSEPIASTSLYPYLPEMVESFQVPHNEVGKWAGLCASMFSLSQAAVGIVWGRFSDRYGRKPAILLGLTSTMITMLLWGFSTSLPMALVARAIAGAGNGNVGILRTTVAEMVPYKELQPRAFSIMPLVWNVGSIFGPMLGGALANPLRIKPYERRRTGSLFEVYPYALPNIVASCLFALSIILGILFLEETMEGAKDRKDYGLVLGSRIFGSVKKFVQGVRCLWNRDSLIDQNHTSSETDPLIRQDAANTDSQASLVETKQKVIPPSWREVLNRQAAINLLVYTMLACHTMAYDQLVPVFMHYDSISSPGSTPYTPPFRWSGGFELDTFTIGVISTCNGIAGMLCQFFVFPPLARRFGTLFWLKIVACVYPIVYFLTPFLAILPSQRAQIICQFILLVVKNFCGSFAFPCSTILLTNSASSLRTLGTLNGIATSLAALGRAAGPASAGAIFTLGVKSGYIIAPFWLITALSVIAAIPVFWLSEGKGFGIEDEAQDGDEEALDDEVIQAAAAEGGAAASGKPGPLAVPNRTQLEEAEDDEHEERSYGGLGPLSRANTVGSSAVADDLEAGSPLSSRSRKVSRDDNASRHSLSRPSSKGDMRKVSMPIGTGRQGIHRSYSANLGQSLGSAGSQHGY